MSILNPRRLTATPPSERIGGNTVVPENIYIEAGLRPVGESDFAVFAAQRNGDFTSIEDGLVVFDLTAAREQGAIPEGTFEVAARAVEERPDLSTDEFPEGVDLLSQWSAADEVRVGHPPMAPTVAVAA